jgi:hypothetical protein
MKDEKLYTQFGPISYQVKFFGYPNLTKIGLFQKGGIFDF